MVKKSELIPMIKRRLKMLLPRILPSAIPGLFFMAATADVAV